MLFILNIIKNNHAQGENTKESIFALFCLQLFISSRTHVKPRMRFSQSIYISLRLRLRKETKYSNYFSKNMNVFLLDNNRIHGIVFRLKTNMTILVIKCFYRRRIINQSCNHLAVFCGILLFDKKNKKILFISLGCDKNLVDSEVMLGILADRGFEMTDTEDDADIIIINTCCFINDAKEESINTILEMAEYKKTGPCKALIVTGCLAQRYKQEIVDEIPEVDAVIGTSKYDEIFDAVDQALKGSHFLDVDDLDRLPSVPGKRILTTGGHYAHLKIAEGCDKHCTYCIIPKIRGNYRSVPMEQLLAEAASLAEQGVKELILVAQETTLYGMDLYGKKSLHILLQELAKIKGIRWIRILYCYPEEIYPELIETIKNEKKVCHYLDMPIQHASDAILKRMGRRTTKAQLKETVSLLRKEIPDIVLRTTLIAGFPGETQEQHEELMEFVDEMEFERLGVFAYSPEENTPAASMPDQIPEEVKEERRDAILELQQEIAFDKAADMVGRTLYAMIEGKVADEPAYVARTYADSPDIDGYVFVNTGEMLMSGDFVKVKITGSAEYDLIGELV